MYIFWIPTFCTRWFGLRQKPFHATVPLMLFLSLCTAHLRFKNIHFSSEQENPHKNDNSLPLTYIFQGEEGSIEVKKKDGSYE
jgi:hypothetical protein